MKKQNAEIPLKEIIKVFEGIEAGKILAVAKNIQAKLITDENLILKGNKDEYKLVTQADIEIQKILLNYFDNSSLKGTYEVIAEEKILNKNVSKNVSWKLLIDPLDGTSSFKDQKNTWGVMVGACDLSGVIRYSYNIISSGEIYKTEGTKKLKLKSFEQLIKTKKKILIDVYDYDSGASTKFDPVFEKKFKINSNQYGKTSYPAAIWTGWQLFNQKLNGLLWFPSNQGKKWYPDYDLIFLSALQKRGYEILIGKIENNNALITVAPTKKDVEKLYQIGTNLIPKQLKTKIIKTTDLLIINN